MKATADATNSIMNDEQKLIYLYHSMPSAWKPSLAIWKGNRNLSRTKNTSKTSSRSRLHGRAAPQPTEQKRREQQHREPQLQLQALPTVCEDAARAKQRLQEAE
ncbi:hypothetical protein PybrP1_006806 [[Pythium] brassicae (nom. inval.)]|nr:hypothetical protein PybrP1_006806 [[Pythium] brassicae (nom. inval.)]